MIFFKIKQNKTKELLYYILFKLSSIITYILELSSKVDFYKLLLISVEKLSLDQALSAFNLSTFSLLKLKGDT